VKHDAFPRFWKELQTRLQTRVELKDESGERFESFMYGPYLVVDLHESPTLRELTRPEIEAAWNGSAPPGYARALVRWVEAQE
jgi:hypothetical protein